MTNWQPRKSKRISRHSVGKTPARRAEDTLLRSLVEALDRSTDRARHALDDTHRAVTRSNRRIDAIQKKAARRKAARTPTGIEWELLDAFTKIIERQFKAMAARVDETNRRLDRLLVRLAKTNARKLPPLGKFRAKLQTRPATPSSRLQRLERRRR